MGAEQSLPLWEPVNGYFYELRALTGSIKPCRKTYLNTYQLEAAEFGMYPSKQIIQSLRKIKREIDVGEF